MAGNIIEIKGLCKSFGGVSVLKNTSLEIPEGEIFGLIGLNGAGKTTLIKSLLGLIKPQKGEIKYKGELLLPFHIRREFGYLPENFLPPQEMTAEELLSFLGRGLGIIPSYISSLLKMAGLNTKKRAKHYSRGMIQRLGLCCALLKNPRIVVLDEPALGLDPVGQRDMLKLLLNINKKGATVFFSSHSLNQVERICHRIAIINKGEIIFCGRIDDFKKRHQAESFEEAFLEEVS